MRLIRQSWQLFATSVAVMGRAPRLFLLPIFGLLAVVVVGAVVFVPAAIAVASADPAAENPGAPLAVAFLVFIPVAAIVSGYFNAALVACTLDMLRGRPMRLGGGLARATARLPAVALFALLSALVSMLAALVRGNGDDDENLAVTIIRGILAAMIDTAWFFATFLALPLIVDQRLGALPAIRRSLGLLRETWGETLSAGVGLGVVGLVVLLPALILPVPAAAAGEAGNTLLAIALIGLTFAWLAAGWVLLTALGQVYRAAVYLYVTERVVAAGFDEPLLRGAFRGRGPRLRTSLGQGGSAAAD